MKSAILAATVLALGVYAQSEVKINTPTSLVQVSIESPRVLQRSSSGCRSLR